ncbi:DNA-directed RNA polymerase I subunit RPA12 [Auxenochlorella protothecoides]|uniref:DNA-directed RNA polymerase subunit n=1 Tax=Auxenochlorella protothecoides TaxID=3075 RepID=A0A087SCE6_AUXPR|nr:DNA-directed RNA polymerase I subunit RPA12 [Auxenochlorella protothecoides]KFM23400.1 DNA-directed RNA polymerase I subunit RPA12 [Auxenochlorella protothecoides]RMZ55231.1 hypothetical protein APUTEX25_005509 [Auxenochlorella protothecoides]|eukprot:RMZ55231.1 hypothetical protein APUTEX25_005509 [Auxenochlorella protothecoides]
MQTASSSGLLFCPYTGSMLVFDPLKNIASSKLSGYTRQLHELEGQVKVTQTTDMVDFARRFGLEMLVRPESVKKEEDELLHGRTRATVDEVCPDCGAQGMEFYTLQLRSADEGQTVFYECTECGHKHSTNN